VPREIILSARRTLQQLEARSLASRDSPQAELPFAPPAAAAVQDLQAEQLRARLAALDPDSLTPRAALELLYELRRSARP
jgi:DNA mismatch repair protein MutS